MADARFYFANVVDSATLTVSSEAAAAPKENLQDRDQKTYGSPSATATWTIQVNATAAVACRALGLAGHNLYTDGVTGIYLQGCAEPTFASPTNIIGTPGAPRWFERFSATQTFLYWKLGVVGAKATSKIGDLYILVEVDCARHPGGQWGEEIEEQGSFDRTKGTVSATTWGDGLDIHTLGFLGISKTIVDAILAAYRTTVRGRWLPWWYTNEYGAAKLLRFDGSPQFAHQFGALWNGSARVKDE
jgi:hypothetical protein